MSMKIIEKIKSDEILLKINSNFDNEVYLVGGSVRDYLMNIDSYDRDLLVVDEDSKSFALKISDLFGGTFVPLDEENKIYRVVLPNKIDYIDITNPIENSLEKDLMRRDLTINSVAVNIKSGEVVDITGGITDIKNKVIRGIIDENFKDDPLRLLRVFRFQSIYGFDVDIHTLQAVIKYSDLITKPAVERINYEILKLFSGKFADLAIQSMDSAGILEKIFPFVDELKKVPPNSHHHLDLFHHSIETVRQIQQIYESSSEEVIAHLKKQDFGGHSRLAHLKMAGFMHDIGKYSTWTIEDSGRHRFIKHDDVGSKLAKEFLKKMHLSNRQIEYICKMIKFHIYPSSVMAAPEINNKIMMRYLRKMEFDFIDVIILAKADRLSARGPEITDKIVEDNINSLSKLQDFCLVEFKNLKPLPILLDGNEIMKLLNIKPSRQLGKILDALHEAQISGDILTKEHAVKFVQNIKID